MSSTAKAQRAAGASQLLVLASALAIDVLGCAMSVTSRSGRLLYPHTAWRIALGLRRDPSRSRRCDHRHARHRSRDADPRPARIAGTAISASISRPGYSISSGSAASCRATWAFRCAYGQPVLTVILDRFPLTLELALLSMVIALVSVCRSAFWPPAQRHVDRPDRAAACAARTSRRRTFCSAL